MQVGLWVNLYSLPAFCSIIKWSQNISDTLFDTILSSSLHSVVLDLAVGQGSAVLTMSHLMTLMGRMYDLYCGKTLEGLSLINWLYFWAAFMSVQYLPSRQNRQRDRNKVSRWLVKIMEHILAETKTEPPGLLTAQRQSESSNNMSFVVFFCCPQVARITN